MIQQIYNFPAIQKILEKRRAGRVKYILSKIKTFQNMTILDIGCGPDGRSFEHYLPSDYVITGIDLYEERKVKVDHPNFIYYMQDASDLSMFNNKSYDLAVSIGMMEHICNKELLNHMAKEIARVAKQYIIVVPWRYCWIEPHFKIPFFPLLPNNIQNNLTKMFNLNLLGKTVARDIDYIVDNYSWLSNSEWKTIYLGSEVYICPTLETIAIVKSTV